jgi:hypothetical protein
MKKHFIFQTLAMLFFVFTTNARQGINYKAIIHDANGDPSVDTPVTVQFTILVENGTASVYQETHNPTTDANGIVIVNIGEGAVLDGDFTNIDRASNPDFSKTEIDSGDGLAEIDRLDFKTEPYALYVSSFYLYKTI